MKQRTLKILFILFTFCITHAYGSHIVGGEVTYRYLGASGANFLYQVHLTIYEDCLNGSSEAIAQDNPAFLFVYTNNISNPRLVAIDTSIFFNPDSTRVVPVNFTNACVSNIPQVCLLKKTFITTFALPASNDGYIVSYQRCCRNSAIVNIAQPDNNGATYYCTIPSTKVVEYNNSAVFRNFPPQIICLRNPLYYDNSATDPDGDSLSYSFDSSVLGASPGDVKPFPGPPPYAPVTYVYPYSAHYPVSSAPRLQIDPITGILTGTPNLIGRFLVNVCCHEWRHGVLINTIRREFQFVVTDCSKVVVACIPQFSTDVNTYVVQCNSFTVNFVNCSSGGFSYHWDFGVPGATNDTSNVAQPTFTYPDTGVYEVKLIVNPRSTCPDSITRFVKIYPLFATKFSDSGTLCPGVPISFVDMSTSTIKPITNWNWTFGDGGTATLQNPQHTYTVGGSYNVTLISQNIKNCVDTSVRQIIVENFKPFAGKDTIIVKGESVQFNATGGNQYLWTPATNLNNPDINDPIGYYPDTGTYFYYLSVESVYGCKGYDTIKVWVVNQAEIFVPTAFTPNGDGKNDIFRPVAVGYKSINFFKVYDRWGEEVYNGSNLSDGWDGTYSGKPAELGTYFWQISFVNRYGRTSYMKGDVTLVR